MMKRLMMLVAMAVATLPIMADTEVVDGITWTYTVSNGKASVGGGSRYSTAVPKSTSGAITIPSTLGGYSVTSIGHSAFYGCSSLTSVTIPDSVTSIGYDAFYNCSGLTSVTIGNGVTSIGDSAFSGCSGLTGVTIPDSVTSIGSYAFYYCSGLTRVTIGNGVSSIESSAFSGCSGLMSFLVAEDNAAYKVVAGLLLTKDSKTLVSGVNGDVTIPNSVTSIGDYAFYSCSGLTSVTIDDGVTNIGSSAFSNCSGLTSVTIPDSVTSIGSSAFSYCSGLTSVTIPDGVTSIGSSAFYSCSGLTSVTIPDSVTSIGDWAFYGCSGLTSVTIPDSVTSIGDWAFYCCSELTSVTIGNGVTSIGSYAFAYCSGLTSVTIGNGVTSIGFDAFYDDAIARVDYWCAPPAGIGDAYILGNGVQRYPREYGARWQKIIGVNYFYGYLTTMSPKVEIVSSSIRENDPTIMDVVYKVTSSKPTVKVRALAFEDGERSFAKVVRPETFIEGTAANVGDEVAANVEHTLSWQVSSDWQTRLAKLKFEVLVCEGELLPMEWMTIPASDAYGKMKVSWNAQRKSQIFDALLWLYADKDPGLTLASGVLKNNSTQLASGTGTSNPNAIRYIYSKMGYDLLSGAALNYVNEETRLGLSPSGARQYAYKIVEDVQ